VPPSQQDTYTKGQISGLAITTGLITSNFLFLMCKGHMKIGATLEVLRQMKAGRMNTKDAASTLRSSKDMQVNEKLVTEKNLCFETF
jgi:hypothetical protein